MKPESKLLELYKTHSEQLKNSGLLPIKDDEKTLKNATAYPALNKLCNGNKEVMAVVLYLFLRLSGSRRIEKIEQTIRRSSKTRNKPREIKNFIYKLTQEAITHIENAHLLDPSINKEKLMNKMKTWILMKTYLHLQGIDRFDSAVNFIRMIDPDTDYTTLNQALNRIKADNAKDDKDDTRIDFSGWLVTIYTICKDLSNLRDNDIYTNFSKILNSLGIKNKQGKDFTKDNVKSIIKRALSSRK